MHVIHSFIYSFVRSRSLNKKSTKRNFDSQVNSSVCKAWYNEIAVVQFVNLSNELPVVVPCSEMVVRIDYTEKQ